MTINDLYKIEFSRIPFSEQISEGELFKEYMKAPMIPSFDLFLNEEYPGVKAGDIPERDLHEAKAQFDTAHFQKKLPNSVMKHDLHATPTYKNLKRIEEAYHLFLKEISQNENPEIRIYQITVLLSALSLTDQEAIIEYMLTDESIQTNIITGKWVLNQGDLKPVPFEKVEQRLADFKNKLAHYKVKLTNPDSTEKQPKEKAQKELKPFKDYFLTKDLKKLDELKKYFAKLHKARNNQKQIAMAIHFLQGRGDLLEHFTRRHFLEVAIPGIKSDTAINDYLRVDGDNFCAIDFIISNNNEKDTKDRALYHEISRNITTILHVPHVVGRAER